MPADESSLIDIVHAGNRILDSVAGLDRTVVESNAMIRAAVGPLRVPDHGRGRRAAPAGVPLPPARDPRELDRRNADVLIYGYDRIAFDRVGSAIERALPDLLAALTPMRPEEPDA